MRSVKNNDPGESREPVWPSLFLAAFGIAVLAFLIVIDRHGMSVRPAPDTGVAMSYVSQAVGGDR